MTSWAEFGHTRLISGRTQRAGQWAKFSTMLRASTKVDFANAVDNPMD